MTRIIFEIVRYLTLIIWAVAGLIFWFPFLVRMIAFFIVSILVSAGGKNNMLIAQKGLDSAIRFYPEGFNNIQVSINNLINGNIVENKSWNPKIDFWMPLAEHMTFASIFWVISVVSYIKIVQL